MLVCFFIYFVLLSLLVPKPAAHCDLVRRHYTYVVRPCSGSLFPRHHSWDLPDLLPLRCLRRHIGVCDDVALRFIGRDESGRLQRGAHRPPQTPTHGPSHKGDLLTKVTFSQRYM